ncbi:serine/threonine-protein phosphatase [candidate division KSB1 bacterium]|nr:serine/threonine-protein phosphatase [candidate division KSB1 bacterium]
MIQNDILDIFLALIVIIFGLIALVLSLFRCKSKDHSLLSIGTFALLYGIRYLAQIQSMQTAVDSDNITLPYIESFITYLIPIPFFVFIIQIFGKGRYNLVLWALRTCIVFAIIGICSDILLKRPSTLHQFSAILVIFWVSISITNIFKRGAPRTREENGFLIGLFVFSLFVINANLVGLNIVTWNWNKEELGFLFLLVCLGYIAANRFFDNEKKLITVNQEMATAREIQSYILPQRMPSIEGLDIVARYIPTSAIAGDFYDFLVKDNRICILLADVSGHGVGAALIGSMLKIAFASQEEHMSNPARVLQEINRTMHSRIEGNFVTACCIYIDTDKGLVEYANAGHPPSLLYRENEAAICDLTNEGIILGPFPDAIYNNVSLPYKMNDRILLYTDGITEALNPSGEFFGDQRLKDYFRSHVDLTTSQFIDELFDQLYTWSNKTASETLDDDLTAIVIDFD